ncbi:MAG: hypothetical protein HOH74_18460 [Gemmatimonadetes bacterium]|nr:hypothetical protein [Gemmatimonadota bacterium]
MRVRKPEEERTSFQEAGPLDCKLESRADVAMVYGLNESFEGRLEDWRNAGYRPHVMTGVAWGGYQDYVRGEWDGQQHYDDAQAAAGGFKLEHGVAQGHDCFYMMPSRDYARYLGEKLRRVVDAGAIAIHLEEPEFWVRAGYGEGFKREWQAFYGEAWQNPASSPDARYRASRLMQHLYTRTLDFLCSELKKYAAEKGNTDFRCYVPTHSLVNYAHWRIVSPESEMLALEGCDGLIGQVWTGTSRTPTVYRGVTRQRTLEAGYCEYAACAALVRGTDKRLWQLADPIEDNPNYCWEDYRVNWECTVTGSLLVEESERFEITPWPSRVFKGTYPTVSLVREPLQPLLEAYLERLAKEASEEQLATTQRAFGQLLEFYRERGAESRKETLGFADLGDTSEEVRFGDLWSVLHGFYKLLADWEDQEDAQRLRDAVARFYHNPTDQRSAIPESYATELQVVFNALADMHWPGDTQWLHGQSGVGVAIADSLMFQRGEPEPSDADMSSLYGLAMPLIKFGTALTMVQLERAQDPGYLDDLQVLLLTYEGQKPPKAQIHERLAEWVHQGGALILFGTGDAYDAVREWWNQEGMDFARPQEHLTELLDLGRSPADGVFTCGKGVVIVDSASPAQLAHHGEGADRVMVQLREAHRQRQLSLAEGNALVLRRGPYVVAAGMDESSQEESVDLEGTFVNLYDAELGVCESPTIVPDSRWLLYDLSRCPEHPWVIASAGKVREEEAHGSSLSFVIEGMAETTCSVRVRVPVEPAEVTVSEGTVEWAWDGASRTALLRLPNRPEGTRVEIRS